MLKSCRKGQDAQKFKVYELDFGDTNVLDEDPKALLDWIDTEIHDMKEDDSLQYTITIRMMTRQEINDLPEWS